MYHIILCDDDSSFLDYMKQMLWKAGLAGAGTRFYEFCSGEELKSHIADIKECDLCILDMQMSVMDGDAAARIFRSQFPSELLVFCSGAYQPTTKSFEVQPYRYLLKSYTEERMLNELKQIVKKVKKQRGLVLLAKASGAVYRLRPEEVLYIEHIRNGSKFHLHPLAAKKKGFAEATTATKLVELYKELSSFGFGYAHNSYIVNLRYVEVFEKSGITLINGESLSVSRSKQKDFYKAFTMTMRKY